MLHLGYVPVTSKVNGKTAQRWSRREQCILDGKEFLKKLDYCLKYLGVDAVNKEIKKLLGNKSMDELLEDEELNERYERLVIVMCEAAALAKQE